MKKGLLVALALALVAVAVVPALADDGGPDVAVGGQGRRGLPPEGEAAVDAASLGPSAVSEVGPNAITIYMWTNLSRILNGRKVKSQGWTSATRRIPRAQVQNYLCKQASCTNWCSKTTRRCRWQWCGWTKSNSATWTWYYTHTKHRFKVGGIWRTRHTELGATF